MPALESSHALAHAMKIAPAMRRDKVLLVNLSGRGDKDMHTVAKYLRHRRSERTVKVEGHEFAHARLL